jgi:hypothetical protein
MTSVSFTKDQITRASVDDNKIAVISLRIRIPVLFIRENLRSELSLEWRSIERL